jgi:uncharacterized delta-60 repeat protein
MRLARHTLTLLGIWGATGCFSADIIGTVSSSALSATLPSSTLAIGASLTVTVDGGALPYTLSATSGTVSGLTYTAPSSVTGDSDEVTLTLTDASGDRRGFPLLIYSPGELDSSFGGSSLGTTVVATVGGINAFTFDSQERIYAGTSIGRIVRFSADGVQDLTYNGGALTITLGGGFTTISIQHAFTDSQGRMVFSGNGLNGGWNQGFAVRLTSSGELDTTFGTGGKAIIPYSGTGTDLVRSVLEDSQRRLLVAGRSGESNGDSSFGVARLLENGSIDTTYGTLGWAKIGNPGNSNTIEHAFFLPGSESLYFVGRSWDHPTYSSALASFLSDGSDNTAFPGYLITALGAYGGTGAFTSLVQDAQHWILGGMSTNGTVDDLLLYRLNINPISLDTTFGVSGVVTINLTGSEQINELVVGKNSKILACGESVDFRLIRTSANGALDTTFGPSGRRSVDLGDSTASEGCKAMLLDSKGRIVAAGWSGSANAAILRMWD